MKLSVLCIFSVGLISTGMALKCYQGASDDAREPPLITCDSIYDSCAKITTNIGTKKVFCNVNHDHKIVEDCKTSEASKCYCNNDQCNKLIEKTTTVKATTKQAVVEEITQQVEVDDVDDNENLRSEIPSTESPSNAATSSDKVNLLTLAGMIFAGLVLVK